MTFELKISRKSTGMTEISRKINDPWACIAHRQVRYQNHTFCLLTFSCILEQLYKWNRAAVLFVVFMGSFFQGGAFHFRVISNFTSRVKTGSRKCTCTPHPKL